MYDGTDKLKGKQLPVDKLMEELEEKIHEIDAKRVVLDTLATLFLRFPDKIERRIAIVDLIEALSDMNITTIITTELESTALERKLTLEEYMVHGVILMEKIFSQGSTVRALQVDKMRTARINENKVPYSIDQNGNTTQISPHDPVTGEWRYFSKNIKTGRVLEINMEELIFDIAKEMSAKTGKTYIKDYVE